MLGLQKGLLLSVFLSVPAGTTLQPLFVVFKFLKKFAPESQLPAAIAD
tara:strand:- start:810 stop:953 length:144 start_codon:yes stop_codon:yes gene_type:complete